LNGSLSKGVAPQKQLPPDRAPRSRMSQSSRPMVSVSMRGSPALAGSGHRKVFQAAPEEFDRRVLDWFASHAQKTSQTAG
jgi:hypothetical protein